MRRLFVVGLALAGCERAPQHDDSPGGRLEATAVARGLVADPAAASLAGVWSSETDRLCVLPDGDRFRLGATVDYGEGQACTASGTVERRGTSLRVEFGDCRFDARFDGDRVTFPAQLPSACARLCSGRASFTALAVERQSESVSEARLLRGPAGRPICGD